MNVENFSSHMKFFTRTIAIAVSIAFIGCAAAPPKTPITSLYKTPRDPAYDFVPAQTQKSPAGYTVGIINMQFSADGFTPKDGLSKQYLRGFISGFSGSLEKILTSKGITVSGPFESYAEMTYPERSRCDFLIQPSATVAFSGLRGRTQRLEGYGGPNGQDWIMGTADVSLKAKAELEYVILDPLTQEKLERHKLKTDQVSAEYKQLQCSYVIKRDEKGNVVETKFKSLDEDEKAFPGYHNEQVAIAQMFEQLYAEFMPKIDKLISVAEFDHLKKYKDELKQKKVY